MKIIQIQQEWDTVNLSFVGRKNFKMLAIIGLVPDELLTNILFGSLLPLLFPIEVKGVK